MERVGRRPTAMLYFFMGVFWAIVLFQVDSKIVAFPALILAVFFGLGVAPVMGAFATELFPTHVRSQSAAWVRNVFEIAGYIGGPALVGYLGDHATGAIGSIGDTVSLIMLLWLPGIYIVWRFIPETKGMELEDIHGVHRVRRVLIVLVGLAAVLANRVLARRGPAVRHHRALAGRGQRPGPGQPAGEVDGAGREVRRPGAGGGGRAAQRRGATSARSATSRWARPARAAVPPASRSGSRFASRVATPRSAMGTAVPDAHGRRAGGSSPSRGGCPASGCRPKAARDRPRRLPPSGLAPSSSHSSSWSCRSSSSGPSRGPPPGPSPGSRRCQGSCSVRADSRINKERVRGEVPLPERRVDGRGQEDPRGVPRQGPARRRTP